MNNQQEKLILETLFVILGCMSTDKTMYANIAWDHRSKITDRLKEIQKEEKKEKR